MPRHYLTNLGTGYSSLWRAKSSAPSPVDDTTICTFQKDTTGYVKVQPGTENTTVLASLPAAFDGYGWRFPQRKGGFAAGFWTFNVKLITGKYVPGNISVYVRLWKSPNADGSNAVAITDWLTLTTISSPTANTEYQVTEQVSLDRIDLNNEYLFAEFALGTTSACSSSQGCPVTFRCNESATSAIDTTDPDVYLPSSFTILSEGWLSGWQYRKSHVINSAEGAGTGYQVRIKAHYGSGTDSGEDVYLNGKCRTDFGDVRFTDDDGVTLLDYWMEKKVDGDYAVFWVKIADDLSSSNATIYIYYGKSDATTTSDGEATFPWLFDDFADYNVGDAPNTVDWETVGTSANDTITVQQDPADATKKCFRIVESGDGTSTALRGLLKDYRTGFALHFRTRQHVDETLYYNCFEDGTFIISVRYDETPKRHQWYNGSAWQEFTPQTPTISMDSWYDIIWKVLDTGTAKMVWNINETDYEGGFRATPTVGINKVEFNPFRLATQTLYIGGIGQDNRYIFARKFTYPEPSHGSWGSEESAGVESDSKDLSSKIVTVGHSSLSVASVLHVGKPVPLEAKLVYDSTPLANKPVTFYYYYDGQWNVIVTKYTNENGIASYTHGMRDDTQYKVVFSGNAEYESSEVIVDYRHVTPQDVHSQITISAVVSGSSNLRSSFAIQHITSIDLPSQFTLRKSASDALSSSFTLRHASSINVSSTLTPQHRATVTLSSSITLRKSESVSLPSTFTPLSSGFGALSSSVVLRKSSSQVLSSRFTLQKRASANLLELFTLQKVSLAVLSSQFTLHHAGTTTLSSWLTLRHLAIADLSSRLVPRVTSSVNLTSRLTLQHLGTSSLSSRFALRHYATKDLSKRFSLQKRATSNLRSTITLKHWASKDLSSSLSLRHLAITDLSSAFEVGQGYVDLSSRLSIGFISDSRALSSAFTICGFDSKDLPCSTTLRKTDVTELSSTFEIQQSAYVNYKASLTPKHYTSTTLPSVVTIRKSVFVSLPSTFTIRKFSEKALSSRLTLEHSASVTLSGRFTLRKTGSVSLLSALTLRHREEADLGSQFTLRRSSLKNLSSLFAIQHISSTTLSGQFTPRKASSSNILSKLTVQHKALTTLPSTLELRKTSTESLSASFTIRHTTSKDLSSTFTVGQGFSNLRSEFSIGFVSKWIQLSARVTLRHYASTTLSEAFTVQYSASTATSAQFTPQHTNASQLLSQFTLRKLTSTTLRSKFISSQQASTDYHGTVTLRHIAAMEICSRFISQSLTVSQLSSCFTLRHYTTNELRSILRPQHSASTQLKSQLMVQAPASLAISSSVTLRHTSSTSLSSRITLRHKATAALSSYFITQQLVTVSLSSSLIVQAPSFKRLPSQFTLRHSASISVRSEFTPQHSAAATISASFITQQATSTDVRSRFTVQQPASANLPSTLEVTWFEGSASLSASLLIPFVWGSVNLLSCIIIIPYKVRLYLKDYHKTKIELTDHHYVKVMLRDY